MEGTIRGGSIVASDGQHFAGSLNLALDMHCGVDSVFLCDMPLFHTAGLFGTSRTPLSVGGTVLISQKLDAPLTYQRLSDESLGVTHYFCVTQMAMAMRQLPGFDGRRLARLTALITGIPRKSRPSSSSWQESATLRCLECRTRRGEKPGLPWS